MATTVAELVAKLSLDSTNFERGLGTVGTAAEKLTSGLKAVGLAAGVLITAFGAAAAGVTAMVKSVADQGDQFNKLSQRIGISVEQLSSLKLAAELSDVSIEEFGQSIALLSRRITDFSDRQAEAVDAFGRLKLDPTQFKTTSDLLAAIADKFAAMPDGATKTAVAMDLMGRSGARMIPFLNQGSTALKEIADESRRLGLVWTTDQARAAEVFNDSIERLQSALTGLKTTVFRDLIPAFNEWFDNLIRYVQSREVQAWVEAVARGFLTLADNVDRAAKTLGILPSTGADRLRALREELTLLEKQLAQMQGSGVGNWLNRFFGQDTKTEGTIARLQSEISDVSAGQTTLNQFNRGTGLNLGKTPSVAPFMSQEDQKKALESWAQGWAAIADQELALTEKLIRDENAAWEKYYENLDAGREQDLKNELEAIETTKEAWSFVIKGDEETRKRLEEAEQNALDSAVKQAQFDMQTYTEAWAAVNQLAQAQAERTQALRREFEGFFGSISNTFSTMLTGILEGTQTLEEAFKRLGQNILASLINDVINRGLKMLADMLADVASATQGETSAAGVAVKVLSAIGGALAGSGGGGAGGEDLSIPQYAEGGIVPGAVGAPQLAVVHGGETIIPAGQGASPSIFIDARGAQHGVSAEVMRAIRIGMGQAVNISMARVQDERRRGGMRGFDR